MKTRSTCSDQNKCERPVHLHWHEQWAQDSCAATPESMIKAEGILETSFLSFKDMHKC